MLPYMRLEVIPAPGPGPAWGQSPSSVLGQQYCFWKVMGDRLHDCKAASTRNAYSQLMALPQRWRAEALHRQLSHASTTLSAAACRRTLIVWRMARNVSRQERA